MNKKDDVQKTQTRFVVVTGGVCSSIGKGVLVSSLGTIFKGAGYKINVVKWDPYLNVDPGTMSPLVHGEVFVTADGAETDLDLGHYERFLDINLDASSSITTGKIFHEILQKEREGAYLGGCIQLVPHVVSCIKERLFKLAEKSEAEVVFIEIGGTVGDIEGEIFLETIRQLKRELPEGYLTICHLSYVPYLPWANEIKTKPTQHSVMLLKKAGLMPDAIFLRTEHEIDAAAVAKTALFCGVEEAAIFQVKTHAPIYKLFLDLDSQGVGAVLQQKMKLPEQRISNLSQWQDLVSNIEQASKKIVVGLIVKYHGTNDPYISVIEAIKSAAHGAQVQVKIEQIEAEALERNDAEAWQRLKTVDGVVVPGGFDKRGVDGKILATQWARENNIPFLGLCLGMQVMLIEIARSLGKMAGASSMELNPKTENPVITLLDEQQDVTSKGATMRLGSYLCAVRPGSKAHKAYKEQEISERHRHRYEFNNDFKQRLEAVGVIFSGVNPAQNLVEIAELEGHPFMVGVQFHPEFQSRPIRPHPLYTAHIEAILKQKS